MNSSIKQNYKIAKNRKWQKCLCALFSLICLNVPQVQAQLEVDHYWSEDTKIFIEEDRSSIALFFEEPTNVDFASLNDLSLVKDAKVNGMGKRARIDFNEKWNASLNDAIGTFGFEQTNVVAASFGVRLEDGFLMHPTQQIVLKFKKGYSLQDIGDLMDKYELTLLDTSYETIILKHSSPVQTIPIANTINLDERVQWCHPDFLTYPKKNSDPYYNQQYYLNNTGQTIDGVTGTVDADIDAPEAWTLSTGTGVKVAVYDDGVEDHEDLEDGSGNSRVLAGYSLPGGSSNGRPFYSSDAHGQSCAGIIGASHNSIGVKGVAPDVDIVPIWIDFDDPGGSTPSELASGITWAWDVAGVDIISNSWGYDSICVANPYPVLTDAINDAMTMGRNGLGTVVVFASGNDTFCVSYPATIPGVIAVGALGIDGTITSYSNSGPEQSVMGFGGEINPKYCTPMGYILRGDIRTLDRPGSNGYNPPFYAPTYNCNEFLDENYTKYFSGTSAACPMISGIAALLLEVDSTLTAGEVKCRIESHATDIGASGFDNIYGNGRANAYYTVALDDMDLIDEEILGVQDFYANETISSGADPTTIKSGANVVLKAGTEITLKEGFTAEAGSDFTAQLDTNAPCDGVPLTVSNETGEKKLEPDLPIIKTNEVKLEQHEVKAIKKGIEKNLQKRN